MNPRTKKPVTDKNGTEIPRALLPCWERAGEAKALIGSISELINHLKQAEKDKDLLYSQVNIPATINDLNKARTALSCAVPSYVCPQCAGHPSIQPRGECRLCLGLGLLSKFRYDRLVAQEVKTMLEQKEK